MNNMNFFKIFDMYYETKLCIEYIYLRNYEIFKINSIVIIALSHDFSSWVKIKDRYIHLVKKG